MKPEIKLLWLKALKSGKYKHGTDFLARYSKSRGGMTYCPFGVLTELFLQAGHKLPKGYVYKSEKFPLPAGTIIPTAQVVSPLVTTWAQLPEHHRSFVEELNDSSFSWRKPFSLPCLYIQKYM